MGFKPTTAFSFAHRFGVTMPLMHKHFSETTGHQRLMYGAAVGVAVALLPLPITMQSHGLLAWCAGALTYLVLAWWLAVGFDATRTRDHAQAQDQPGLILFALVRDLQNQKRQSYPVDLALKF